MKVSVSIFRVSNTVSETNDSGWITVSKFDLGGPGLFLAKRPNHRVPVWTVTAPG